MRKLFKELFYTPKHGKIREKTMTTRLITTITIMVMCLAAMSISAYAYFSYNVTSNSNIIKSANFYTDVTVQIKDANGNDIQVITSDYISHLAKDLKANETYFVTLNHTESSTAKTGFIIVTAKDCKERYHTQQLTKDENGKSQPLTFKIIPSANTDVTFYSHWGTSSYYPCFKEIGLNDERYIIQNEEIKMTINSIEPSDETTSDKESTNTDSSSAQTTPSNENTSDGESTITDSSSTQTTPTDEVTTTEIITPETTPEE